MGLGAGWERAGSGLEAGTGAGTGAGWKRGWERGWERGRGREREREQEWRRRGEEVIRIHIMALQDVVQADEAVRNEASAACRAQWALPVFSAGWRRLHVCPVACRCHTPLPDTRREGNARLAGPRESAACT